MLEIDARGLSCPEPVLLTAEVMRNHKNEKIKVVVNEVFTKNNVEKYVKSQKKKANIVGNGTEFEIIIE